MIYIVDDDENVRKAFVLLLKSASYKAMAFNGVAAFLSECTPTSSDLLILDMHMPVKSGSDLLGEFVQKGFKMPIIVVTAYDTIQSRESAQGYGVVAFLRKPVDGDALIDMVKHSISMSERVGNSELMQ